MYPIVSSASIIIRFYLCYITIEALPIFSNEAIGWILGQAISIYTIFRLICYPIVGKIGRKFDIKSSTTKSVVYFILYLPLAGTYWVALLILTRVFGVLPL